MQGQVQQPARVPAQLIDQVQRSGAADVAREQQQAREQQRQAREQQRQAREQQRQAVAAVLATATGGATFQQALTARSISWQVQKDAAGRSSMRFTQGGHTFAGTELTRRSASRA